MAGVNKVILVGNVGKDPVISTLNSGDKVAKFTLATSESWKDKNTGERREKTEWHNIVIYNDNLVGVIERFVKKGSKLYIDGQLSTRKFTDRDGAEKFITEIVLQRYRGEVVLLGNKDDGKQDGEQRSSSGEPRQGGGGAPIKPTGADPDDDIPFSPQFD